MVNYPKSRGGRNLGSGGGSSVGAISYDANAIKNSFFSKTSARQAQRISGDGGYWTGGRCDWGAGHNLDEDIQKLVGVFNKVADMSGAVASLKECNSSSEFLTHKNALLAKCNQAIQEMSLGAVESSVGYYSGLCIIWTDYTTTFLTPYISAFTSDLNRQMQEINSLDYEELVKLEELKLEQQEIEKEIKDTYQKYEKETDPSKKAELYQQILSLKNRFDEVGQKITANPWNKAGQYDYSQGINQIIALLEGKANPNQTPLGGSRSSGSGGLGQGSGGSGSSENINSPSNNPLNSPWISNQKPNSNQPNQQTLIFVSMAVGVVIFLMLQKESQPKNSEYDYY